jgi:hypothetical protein
MMACSTCSIIQYYLLLLHLLFQLSLSVKQVSSDVWHFRLGHLSDSRIKLLSQYDPSIPVNTNNYYTVCPLAKQNRLPFPVSDSTSNKIFDLVHCDIWGLFSIDSLNGVKYFSP